MLFIFSLLSLFCAANAGKAAAYYLPGVSPNNFNTGDSVSWIYCFEKVN